jgi:hypothetical protein
MRDEGGLDLEGPDPVARGDDDVVVAALEPEVAVLVFADLVPGRPPLAVERLLTQVVTEEGRNRLRFHLQLPLDDPRLDSRKWTSHRAVAARIVFAWAHTCHGTCLGLTVAVSDAHSERFPEEPDHLGVERLAGGDQAA